MRRRSYFRRALSRVATDRTGEHRWIIVNKATGKLVGLRMTYPAEHLAQANCGPDEEPKEVVVAGNAGPFSDRVEAVERV